MLFSYLFLSTLNSYYFYGLGISVDQVCIFFIFIVMISSRNFIPKPYFPVILLVYFLVTCGFLITLFIVENELFLKTAISIALYALFTPFILFGKNALSEELEKVPQIIGKIVIFHCTFLIIQTIVWYFFNRALDFLAPVTGEAQRFLGGTFLESLWFRPTGLFNEPGTFAAYVMVLLVLYLLSNGNSKFIIIIGIASVAGSFSIQGYIMLGFFMITVIKKYLHGKAGFWSAIILLSLFFILIISAQLIFKERFSGDIQDASLANRQGAFSAFLNSLTSGEKLFGHGFTSPPALSAGATLILYLWSYFGLFSLIVLFPILVFCLKFTKAFIPIIILFSTKITPTTPFFWLALYLILFLSQKPEKLFDSLQVEQEI